jgi:hypothetical protein
MRRFTLIVKDLALPELSEQQIAQLDADQRRVLRQRRKSAFRRYAGDLARRALGVDDEAATNFIKSDTGPRSLMQLRPASAYMARTSEDGELQQLTAR